MRLPVLNKTDMYKRLAAGEFGSTIPQYFSLCEWRASGDDKRFPVWGVRTMTPGGPCRLNCPAHEVEFTATEFERWGHRVNISRMIDTICTVTAWLEIWDSPTGLVVEGIPYPLTKQGWTWRNSMPDPARRKRWERSAGWRVLETLLNPNSMEDVRGLISEFPDHVIELSTVDICFGTVPDRDYICWECRAY